jgi:type II secretory pathway predicted ATPase ExeA
VASTPCGGDRLDQLADASGQLGRALDQRIATRFTIKPMDLAESAAYLRHHLKLAGRDEPLFADDAIARLHRVSNGLPRALNNAAVAALIAAAAAGKDLVDDACAKKAVAELTRD